MNEKRQKYQQNKYFDERIGTKMVIITTITLKY